MLDLRRILTILLLAGALCLAVGLLAAHRTLPEWQLAQIPDEATLHDRFQELLEPLGMELEEGEPTAHLRTPNLRSTLTDTSEGETWIRVRMSQPAAWRELHGGLARIDFEPSGLARSLDWEPLRLTTLFRLTLGTAADDLAEESLVPVVLAPGESAGEARRVEVGGTEVCLFPVLDTDPPEHVRVSVVSNLVIELRRLPGDLDHGTALLRGAGLTQSGFHLLLRALLFLGVLVVFLVLLFLRRIDLRDGLSLALLSFVVSCLGAWSHLEDGLVAWQVFSTASFTAFFLFLLWSAAESWIRTAEPDFTTSFDLLRNGRLGPRSGRALLAGWGAGAALGGLDLLIHALAQTAPGVLRREPSVDLPLFGGAGHPLYDGSVTAGLMLLALATARRFSPKRWRRATVRGLGALFLSTAVPFDPWIFSFLGSLLVASLLEATYRRFGLTTMLTAGWVGHLLPAMVFAVGHLEWLGGSAIVTAVLAFSIPVLGFVGLRRPIERRREALVPTFVKRVEEERRLRYEMDLLVRMQLGMLPGAPPEVEGWDLAAESFLATEAGGDLYEFLCDEEERLWVAAGDVAGHGYACALELAMVKSALHSVVSASLSPAQVLDRVDHALRSSRSVRSFTTLTLVRLDLETGKALVANAGHPFPLLAKDGEAEEIPLPGLPLGQGPPREYVDQEIFLPPGASLLLSSDGLFESLDEAGEPFGFDRPRILFGESPSTESARNTLRRLVAHWRRHMGSQPAEDDASLVVIRRDLQGETAGLG